MRSLASSRTDLAFLLPVSSLLTHVLRAAANPIRASCSVVIAERAASVWKVMGAVVVVMVVLALVHMNLNV